MENLKIPRMGGAAAAVIAVVCLAAAALMFAATAGSQQTAPCCPAVTTHWQPQSILEAKFTARIVADDEAILDGLQALAKNPDLTPAEMTKYVGATYLGSPRLWTDRGWVEGWAEILPHLRKIILPRSNPTIMSVSVLIEYQPFTGARTPAEDIDAVARIRMTFSASPDGYTLEGVLRHSRVCEIF